MTDSNSHNHVRPAAILDVLMVREVDAVLKSSEKSVRDAAIAKLRAIQFSRRFRAYSPLQVDHYVELRQLELSLPHPAVDGD
jgi:hypothetical protein